MNVDSQLLGGMDHHMAGVGAERVGEGNVDHHVMLEKGVGPLPSAVDELVRHHQVKRLELLFQTAHGADGDDSFHTQSL